MNDYFLQHSTINAAKRNLTRERYGIIWFDTDCYSDQVVHHLRHLTREGFIVQHLSLMDHVKLVLEQSNREYIIISSDYLTSDLLFERLDVDSNKSIVKAFHYYLDEKDSMKYYNFTKFKKVQIMRQISSLILTMDLVYPNMKKM